MIYFYHIQKTGGRSLIFLFLSQVGEAGQIYAQLTKGVQYFDGKLYHGWTFIPKPETYFAWSHSPARWARLPPDTFTITLFRDPVERLVSVYRMILYDARLNKPQHEDMHAWLGSGILDFVNLAPKSEVFNQLAMFSEQLDPDDAALVVKRDVSFYFRLENFDEGIAFLCKKFDLRLHHFHIDGRRGEKKYEAWRNEIEGIIQNELEKHYGALRKLLAPEYELMKRLFP